MHAVSPEVDWIAGNQSDARKSAAGHLRRETKVPHRPVLFTDRFSGSVWFRFYIRIARRSWSSCVWRVFENAQAWSQPGSGGVRIALLRNR
jgi:hypothetical protein